jgi:hypothetical protein
METTTRTYNWQPVQHAVLSKDYVSTPFAWYKYTSDLKLIQLLDGSL